MEVMAWCDEGQGAFDFSSSSSSWACNTPGVVQMKPDEGELLMS